MSFGYNMLGFGAGGSDSLLTGLVSWWSLNEASGTRVDSHGSNDLTETGTVTGVTGKVGDAASYDAVDTLSKTSFSRSADYTVAVWAYPTSAASVTNGAISISSTSDRHDMFKFSSLWQCRTNSATMLSSGVAPIINTWAFLVFGHSGTDAFISVNGAAKVTGARTANSADTVTLLVGDDADVANWSGYLDEAAVWSRELTADEITRLYNSGNGMSYPG